MSLIPFLHRLADAASDAILPHFRTGLNNEGDLINKSQAQRHFDPVTIADRNAEAAMRALILKAYPHHGILGEEFDAINETADHVWILDPIDGTRTFISGLPIWGVLIGHQYKGQAAFGMMVQPFTGERFIGDGHSSWLEHKQVKTKLKTRSCKTLSEATLFTTSPHLITKPAKQTYQTIENQVKLFRYGVDCYAFAMLAAGQIDVVIEQDLKPFDIAALIPIIEGAGGRVTTWTGENAICGGSVVASGDPQLHDRLIDILRHAITR